MWSDFHHVLRSSRSTSDLLAVISDRIARAFSRSGATWAVAPDISESLDMVLHAGLLHKLKSYGMPGWVYGLNSSFLSKRQFFVVADGNSSKEYPVNNGFSAGSIPVLTLFQLYINDLPDDVICNINVYINNTALYSKYEQAPGLWQQLENYFELESDLRDTIEWGRKWLVDCSAGKKLFFLSVSQLWCYWCENWWVCSWRKITFKKLGLSLFLIDGWGSYIISIPKTSSEVIGT